MWMKLSLNLAEDAIIAVKGGGDRVLRIVDCQRYRLPQGSLINDVIVDEAPFKTVLEQIKRKHPADRNKIHLVLGSNQILTKVMQVPCLPHKQLLTLVQRELETYKVEDKEMIYDYGVIRQHNGYGHAGTILGAAIEREKLDYYRKVFKECGMKIKSMNVALNVVTNLAEHLPSLKGKTYILAVLDGRNMQTSLYIDGIYRHTGRIRFLYERNTEELLRETVKEIGIIGSFARSLEYGAPVSAVYFCGLEKEEEEPLFEMLRREKGINAAVPEAAGKIMAEPGISYQLADYAYATGNLLGR